MIDIRLLKEAPDKIRENLDKRNLKDYPLDDLLDLERKRRELIARNQKLKEERNRISLEISSAKRAGTDAQHLISQMKTASDSISRNDKETQEIQSRFELLLSTLPNFVDPSVPLGNDETANVVLRKWGDQEENSLDHVDIADQFDMVDIERAAKTSGARFYFLRRDLARLNYALITFALDYLRDKGFILIQPPYMLKREAIGGAVILGDFEDVIYKVENEDLYLIGTSEHAIAAMHMAEVFDGDSLPIRYAGISPCFRKEAGAHGKDTKGIFRVHQFEKVEQFVYCKPENSDKEHQMLLENAEGFMKLLGVPHRVVLLSSGDMGKVASKTFDIEGWIPSQKSYRELISCSNCTEFQARSLAIKYREKAHEESKFLHTLNSTLVATERTLVAILENYYRKDSRVIEIPKVLVPYMNSQTEIAPVSRPE